LNIDNFQNTNAKEYLKYNEAIPLLIKRVELKLPKAKVELAKYYIYRDHLYDRKTVEKLLQEAIDEGDYEGCYWLGFLHESEEDNGFRYYLLGAKKGDPRCQCHMARSYFFGDDIKQDFDAAFFFAKSSAAAGYQPAHELLAEMHHYSWSPCHSPQNSFQIYYDLQDKNAEDEFRLGSCYHFGHGVPPDVSKALLHITRAAEHQNPHACFHLGKCYLLGDLVPKNSEKAVKYLRAAADQQHIEAKWQLANLWLKGEEVNIFEALKVLNELVALEDDKYTPLAMLLLGNFALVHHNQVKAIDYFSQAAYGYELPKAYLSLGILLYTYNQDDEAMECFEEAEKKGAAEAEFFLGIYYLEGNRLDCAEEYFHKAAKKGVPGAYFELGKLLYKRDEEKGSAYLIKAFKMGYSPFCCKVGDVYVRLTYEPDELRENITACNIAAKRKCTEALVVLGTYYYNEKIWQLAEGYYKKGAELGDKTALERLGTLLLNSDWERGLKYLRQAAEKGDCIARERLGDHSASKGIWRLQFIGIKKQIATTRGIVYPSIMPSRICLILRP
jgi:TPR repeat protein